jgi:hypothetical protein
MKTGQPNIYMKAKKNSTDKKIDQAFKILEEEINKKAETIDPNKQELLAEMTEHIINAMTIFQRLK